MKRCIVLVGVSGSGKSTYARKLVYLNEGQGIILSTDDFFMEDGKYCFDPAKLGLAHSQNLFRFIECCRNEYPLVICDNTNTRMAELAPYVAVAEAYGYSTEIHILQRDLDMAIIQNKHGVPRNTIIAMQERINSLELPPWWKSTIVSW